MKRYLSALLAGVAAACTIGMFTYAEAVVGMIGQHDLASDRALTRGRGFILPTGAETMPGGVDDADDVMSLDPFLDTGSAVSGGTDFGPQHAALHDQLLSALNALAGDRAADRTAEEAALNAAHGLYHAGYTGRAEVFTADQRVALDALHADLDAAHTDIHDEQDALH